MVAVAVHELSVGESTERISLVLALLGGTMNTSFRRTGMVKMISIGQTVWKKLTKNS